MTSEHDSGNFDAWFCRSTGHAPYPYQRELATRDAFPARLEIPTGMGKTQAVLGAWLWRRRFASPLIHERTPRRLVYCLPMRVLVVQTTDVARAMIEGAGLRDDIATTVIMGGEADAPETSPWDVHPERDAIVIGTQDMLISRALNRGYAMSRYRWPIPFGLLNNDCLWVVDEPQLLGAGLPSTAQLHAFRARRFGAFGPTGTLWLSATLDRAWLRTVDCRAEDTDDVVQLTPSDLEDERVQRLRAAAKRIERAPVRLGEADKLAKLIRDKHRPGTRTLVILNTVARAKEVFGKLRALASGPRRQAKQATASAAAPALVLLHSQFRPEDRRAHERAALSDPTEPGTIVVTTQVVEAGVDITSATLFTELAPWASLVQRFGRCNRGAEADDARVFWIDVKPNVSERDAAPYQLSALFAGRAGIEKLDGSASPAAIAAARVSLGDAPLTHVVRARDLLDLFDTTPDLAGADVDVSRFVRDATDRDVHVFWRSFDDAPKDEADPGTNELCSAPIADVRNWLKQRPAWRWDAVDGRWIAVRPEQVYPGLELLLRSSHGGYDAELGWSPDSRNHVPVVTVVPSRRDRREGDDPLSGQRRAFQALTEHSSEVAERADRIATAVGCLAALRDTFVRAARYHDAGKVHAVFQKTMAGPPGGPWAKSERSHRHERRGFRHELASALLALENGESDLLAYLVASHHGKVRIRIRSNPDEKGPRENGRLFAKGVWHGERVGPVDLGDGLRVPETAMNLEYMLMGDSPDGKTSWTARTLRLLEELGPFRLAYLEALLRAADERASGGLP